MKRLTLTLAILVVVLIGAVSPHDTQAAPSDYFDTVQRVYIGYYQRPADPGGLLYWAGRLDSTSGNLTEIIEAYANSLESQELYGVIDSGSIGMVVDDIYMALFNRPAEAVGKTYYVSGFNSGQFTAATIMLNVLYGAQNEDLQTINNKLTTANSFTRTIDPELDGYTFQATYAGEGDAVSGRSFLVSVTHDPASVPTQDETTAYMRSNIADPGDPMPPNAAPVANAGTAQNVVTGALVTLDGSGSSDANGDLLTYSWAFTSKPAGSGAALSSPTAVKPTFTPEVAGTYVLNLVVNDGHVNSVAATVTVTASIANAAPVANAGTAQNVVTGALVTLDGSGSSDANGDLLTYSWAFTSKPAGSGAALSSPTAVKPTFTPEVAGTYVLNLVVNDGHVNSVAATVTVTASIANAAPVANAGTAQNVVTGALVTLDGSGSSDANGDLLTYSWAFTSKPAGSGAALSSPTAVKPTFTPEVAGTYVLNLVVNDGHVNSVAATVTVTASVVNFSSLVGTYAGNDEGGFDITVEVNGSALEITDDDFFNGTCIYSATVSAGGNAVSNMTYRCSDFTIGNWSLSQMKVVDTKDIYVSILVNGTVVKRRYGMSAKASGTVPPIIVESISGFSGTYSGVSNGGPFTVDPRTITVEVTGSALRITDASFLYDTCIYSATISAAGNAVSGGTYQCSDFTTGNWTLSQMKVVDIDDIYLSIRKDGNVTSRMYGAK